MPRVRGRPRRIPHAAAGFAARRCFAKSPRPMKRASASGGATPTERAVACHMAGSAGRRAAAADAARGPFAAPAQPVFARGVETERIM